MRLLRNWGCGTNADGDLPTGWSPTVRQSDAL